MKRSPLAAVFATIVVDLLGFGLVLPLLPLYARAYGASNAAVGAILASYSALQFVAAPLWGRLSDRIGRRPVLLVGLGGSVLAYLLFAAAELVAPRAAVVVLLVSRVAAGAFGGTITAALAYVADVTEARERGRGMALVGAAFGVGFLVGPALGGLGHAWLGPLAPGLLAAGLSASAALFAWRRLPEPPRRVPLANGTPRWQSLARALRVEGVRPVLALTFLGVLAFGILESTLALLARQRFEDWTPAANGWLFSWFGLWLALTQGVVVRRWMRDVEERRLVPVGALVLAAGLLGFAFVEDPLWLGALAPVPVLGSALMMPALVALLSRRTAADRQGQVLGANESVRSLGRILSHALGPVLLGWGALVCFAAAAGAAVLAYVVARVGLAGGGDAA